MLCKRFSLVWFLVPAAYSQRLSHRHFWANYYGKENGTDVVRSVSLGEVACDLTMQTVLSFNGWEIRTLALTEMLPAMDTIILYPKGEDVPWRGYVFLDANCALDHIFRIKAATKKCVFLPYRPSIAESARSSLSGWGKVA